MSMIVTNMLGAGAAYSIICQVKITPMGDIYVKDMWVLGAACNLALLVMTSQLWM